ncbi:hypothetical protein [Desulforhabdus sp. TSK]|nr:hypothetical protein [Desulforhabdus sp. TSK]GKT08595.1 hypothetical protein DSTSK_19000 [Desulforhabdus sp. TSK]
MKTITATEPKTKGANYIDAPPAEEEAVISVRGKDRYVVMGMEGDL